MNKKKAYLLSWFVLSMQSCAVSHKEADLIINDKTIAAKSYLEDSTSQLKQDRLLSMVNTNFIGDTPIELPYYSKLPRIFFEDISLKSRGSSFGTVEQAARNISHATDLSIHVNSDVGSISSDEMKEENASSSETKHGIAVAGRSSNFKKQIVPLNYNGTLLAYLKAISVSADVNWEWKNGGIDIYRLVTKTFDVSNITSGEYTVTDSLNRGGAASTGSAGTANATSNGSFSNSSAVGLRGVITPWRALQDELQSIKSTDGKINVNESLGTVTVTDHKKKVDLIEKLIKSENSAFGKQVAIEVRVIQVSINRESQIGLNLGLIYSALNSDKTAILRSLTSTPPNTNSTSSAGNLTFTVPDPSSSYSGTNISLAGLNAFGDITQDATTTLFTTNRVPVMTGNYSTAGFLAQTTPAIGGAVSGGTGVPGLLPGSVTVGSFIRVLASIKDNNSILVNLSLDLSSLNSIGNATTGAGASYQQIQWANTTGSKSVVNLLINQNESIVTAGISSDTLTNNTNNSLEGASRENKKGKSIFVLIIKPRIIKSS
jgi:hypothetical protein